MEARDAGREIHDGPIVAAASSVVKDSAATCGRLEPYRANGNAGQCGRQRYCASVSYSDFRYSTKSAICAGLKPKLRLLS
jgi:hypothetical protein